MITHTLRLLPFVICVPPSKCKNHLSEIYNNVAQQPAQQAPGSSGVQVTKQSGKKADSSGCAC